MHKRSVVSVSLTPRVEKNTAPKNPIIWWKYLIPYLSYLPGTLQIKVTDFAGQPNFQLTWWRGKLLCSTSASTGEMLTATSPAKPRDSFSAAELFWIHESTAELGGGLCQRAVPHSIHALLLNSHLSKSVNKRTLPLPPQWFLLPLHRNAAIPGTTAPPGKVGR